MPVPKKRTSKSKSRRTKMLWKKKAFKKIPKCFSNFYYLLNLNELQTRKPN
uniref:ribosomal protein L32 n=1 Tax=Caulerpa taxifolia TaxID=76313 RepID=UPI0021D5292A|nr:ribosomal protein L32 [Caulerpa taxifolia]UXC96686.1 ribosomal protein L32 [Caulerpa taxifolia]